MSAPTEVEVGTTIQQLWAIAHSDPDGYRLLAHLVGTYHWLIGQIAESEDASAYGRGASEVHVFATAAGDLEGRLHDPLLRAARRLKRTWRGDLRDVGYRWSDAAANLPASADPRIRVG